MTWQDVSSIVSMFDVVLIAPIFIWVMKVEKRLTVIEMIISDDFKRMFAKRESGL